MSKKDYIAFAKVMSALNQELYLDNERVILGVVMDRIADIFEKDNPNFDRQRFNRACQSESTVFGG